MCFNSWNNYHAKLWLLHFWRSVCCVGDHVSNIIFSGQGSYFPIFAPKYSVIINLFWYQFMFNLTYKSTNHYLLGLPTLSLDIKIYGISFITMAFTFNLTYKSTNHFLCKLDPWPPNCFSRQSNSRHQFYNNGIHIWSEFSIKMAFKS